MIYVKSRMGSKQRNKIDSIDKLDRYFECRRDKAVIEDIDGNVLCIVERGQVVYPSSESLHVANFLTARLNPISNFMLKVHRAKIASESEDFNDAYLNVLNTKF